MRGATLSVYDVDPGIGVSIHAPHAGRDVASSSPFLCFSFVSIHAPHAGRDHVAIGGVVAGKVSIHAPHAGRDQ